MNNGYFHKPSNQRHLVSTNRKRPYRGNRCQGPDAHPYNNSNDVAIHSADVTSQEVGGVSKMADKASQTDESQTADDHKISSSSCDVTSFDGPKKLHFSNLPFRFRESHLRNILTQFGDILNIEIIFNGRGSKGFGFATFARQSEAEVARLQLNGVIIEGRKIEVNEATKNYLKKRISSYKRYNHNHHQHRIPEVIGDGGQTVHSTNGHQSTNPDIDHHHHHYPPPHHHHHHLLKQQQQQSTLKNDMLVSMETPFPPKILTPVQLSPLIFTAGLPVEKPVVIHSSENVILPLRLQTHQPQIYSNNLLSMGIPPNTFVIGGFSPHPVCGLHRSS